MSLGNLSIKVNADIGGFVANIDYARRAAEYGMRGSSDAVNDFKLNILRSSEDVKNAQLKIMTGMNAANDAVVSHSAEASKQITVSAQQSAAAVQKVIDTVSNVDPRSMSEKIAYGIGSGVGAGMVSAQNAWDGFEAWTKAKAVVIGAVVGATFAAVGLGAIYAAYKVIDGSIGFVTGLITGDSYKSASIDALIEANNQVKQIQESLFLTAQQASATNAAIASMGVDRGEYIAVFNNASTAIHANTEELDRLGIKYKDAAGNLLPLEQVIKNTDEELNKYTQGWDRNSAATAIGLGSAKEVAAAASINADAIAAAGARLNDYNLSIGSESQAAVKRYEDAMLVFNRETDLTASGFKRAWADNVMPALTDFAVFFKDGFPYAVNVFRYSTATVTSLFYGIKTAVYIAAESILGSLSAIELGLEGIASAGIKVLSGDFSGAKDALVNGWQEAQARLSLVGTNIVEQARHNGDAMRQAWALDDRADSSQAAKKIGKNFVTAPDKATDTKDAATPIDDVAKRIMEGKIKAQEDLIADEKSLLQVREQFLKNYYSDDSISASEYYLTTQRLAKENFSKTLSAYDQEVAAIKEYIAIHKSESDKKSDIVAAENKITEIYRKKSQEEIAVNNSLVRSYMELSSERTVIANSLMTASNKEDKDYKHRTSVLLAFRDAQLQNAVEGNRLLEQENKRHADAIYKMQSENDLQALSQAASVGDQMLQLLKQGGEEKTALYKTLFIADKAIAIAQILINTEVGAAKALGLGPFGIPMSTIIRTLGYASAGIVAATAIAGAREKGGPVWSGASFLVGEKGPEIFTPSTNGTIIPNDQISRSGGSGDVTINLIEDKTRAGQTQERNNNSVREVDVFVADIMGNGPRGQAIQRAFGLARRGY